MLLGALAVAIVGCAKTASQNSSSSSQKLVSESRSFFISHISSLSNAPNKSNYRACQPKAVQWNQAAVVSTSTGTVVIVPVSYQNRLFVSSVTYPNSIFNLNDLTYLLIGKDSENQFHANVVTFIPDIESGVAKSSGLIFNEDWQGNSMSQPLHMDAQGKFSSANAPTNDSKQIDVVQNIQICNEIDGYNYSPDDPSAGSSWSETSCTTYEFQNPTSGGSVGPPNLGAYLVSHPAPLTISLSAPISPIANIADYFKCFTPGDASHSFTVTLAVEQPDQGTRQPWTFTSGGVSGSSQAGNPINVGHSFLIFSEGSGGQINTQRSVGFYPQGIVTPFSTSAQGILGNDQYTDYNICLTVSVSSSQFFQMLQYVTQGNNSGYMYNLNSNNCTTFALDAIDAGGVSIPSTIGYWVGNGQGLDPGDLGEDIRSMQLPGNMTRNTVSNSHPNVGTCN